ncbi:DNA cytosine methyltransferase [Roseibium sp. RKSG952]|uniref:DNA cytosine methyltransferase n=1 Tax=Roseibium sp. RKSG952 TaxID=2529384 RepID=UPI0012BCB209|nr:DNA cytosine methyltransferase [Roseibium sp. RKSG952]MTH95314.1 DNA cytosine methyltransferase [Roseibium sp. RKSG952]
MSSRPVCVDLFAGAGGLSLGFEQAGFDVACAVELDPVHCAVHKYNFPETAIICGSVSDVDGAQIRERSGIGFRKVSVVFGGSPCQGFSMIGKRSLDDPRNSLVMDFVRIVVDLQADYFVLENVKGLTVGKHKEFLNELVSEFTKNDYEVVLPWKVLNAAWFGVPQKRERLFIIGARKGLKLPSYPEPLTSPAKGKVPDASLPKGPTVSDAISDLPDAELFDALNSRDWVETELGEPSDYVCRLRGLLPDPTDYSVPRFWNPDLLTSSARTDHNAASRSRFAGAEHGKPEPVSRFLKLDPDGLCNTLRAGTGKDRGAYTAARPIHPVHPRCITVREMARLHSYPDWFRFNRTKWSGAREVGNSVPPLLARAVASSVATAMGYEPKKPSKAIFLGNESLLTCNESSAKEALAVD